MPSPTDPRAPLHDPDARGFASDNYAGIHPEVLEAIAAANGGHQVSYGEDVYTARLQEVFREHFGERRVGLPGLQRHRRERRRAAGDDRALGGGDLRASRRTSTSTSAARRRRSAASSCSPCRPPTASSPPSWSTCRPGGTATSTAPSRKVVSITQTTELGTCYTVEEIAAITEHAHERGMRRAPRRRPDRQRGRVPGRAAAGLHHRRRRRRGLLRRHQERPDARRGASWCSTPPPCAGMDFLRKSAMQLASKMRFVSAQFDALLSGDLWLRNAGARQRDGAGASRPRSATSPASASQRPVQANAVFAVLPAGRHRAAAEAVPASTSGTSRPARCAG